MSTTDTTITEMTESLTGYDEIAIGEAFGKRFHVLANDDDEMSVARALVFIHVKRTGLTHAEARAQVFGMPWGQVRDYFAPEPPEDTFADEPESESGKGE